MRDYAFRVTSSVNIKLHDGAEKTVRATVYVDSERRAEEISRAAPGRSWERVLLSEVPEDVRENLLRARKEAGEDAG